jgi:dihydroorotate dehydrogenase
LDLFPLARPVLHRLDPERAHRLTLWGLRHGLGPRVTTPTDPALEQHLWGLRFPNPVGLAAGFDKDGEAVGPLFAMGFGFVEVGSVTPRAQPGNPKPRVFRLPRARGVVNRLGFNSRGLDAVERNLKANAARGARPGVLGINLGKNRDSPDSAADYAEGVARLGPLADYLVVNVSSPNTPGLRALQHGEAFTELLQRVDTARRTLARASPPPLLVKIAPDLTEADMDAIAQAACGPYVDGLIVANTTVERPADLDETAAHEHGGLSGRPLFRPATARLADMYRRTGGTVPLIGVGGVENAETAIAKIRAGASLVQLYTTLIYAGPGVIMNVINGLKQHIRFHEISHLSAMVGADT